MKPKEIITYNLENIIDDLLCSDELRVFMFFYRHSDLELSPLHLSRQEIANKIQYSENKLRGLMKKLIDRKLLEETEKGGRKGNGGIRISLDYPNLKKLDPENLKEVKNMTTEKPLQYELTEDQKAVLEVVKHYEMLVRRVTGKNGFNAISKTNPTAHKNWKYFVRLYVMCKYREWDVKVYIEYAFKHVQMYWKKNPFPYVNQLCAKGIINCFEYWLEKENKKFAHNKGQKERKALVTETIEEEIDRKIKADIKFIKDKMKMYSEFEPEVAKALVIFDNFIDISEFYLQSVSWFLGTIEGGTDLDVYQLRNKITRIGDELGAHIKECVNKYESEFNMPRTLTDDEILELVRE